MEKILVTGSEGLIGVTLCIKLEKKYKNIGKIKDCEKKLQFNLKNTENKYKELKSKNIDNEQSIKFLQKKSNKLENIVLEVIKLMDNLTPSLGNMKNDIRNTKDMLYMRKKRSIEIIDEIIKIKRKLENYTTQFGGNILNAVINKINFYRLLHY